MHLDVRTVESAQALEVFATATPEPGADPVAEGRAMFGALAQAAREHRARPVCQRVFVRGGQLAMFRRLHENAWGSIAADLPTNWLAAGCSPGEMGTSPAEAGADRSGGKASAERTACLCGVGGVQLYAVHGPTSWRALVDRGQTLGWSFEQDGRRWAVAGNVSGVGDPTHSGPTHSDPSHSGGADGPGQAQHALERAEKLLGQAGMDLHDVARTWLFLDDILAWYGPFNQVRSKLFVERGLMRAGERPEEVQVPASTGIGVSPAGGGRISLELYAASGAPVQIRRHAAAGKQRCAYEYGSAFARAAEMPSPAGRMVFVSGTAAIDTEGRTCCVGDIAGQIRMTLENVLAVLKDTQCAAGDVVQAMAYCKTAEVAEAFEKTWRGEVAWPWVTVIGDVCRDDLLFEAEVTACHRGVVVS